MSRLRIDRNRRRLDRMDLHDDLGNGCFNAALLVSGDSDVPEASRPPSLIACPPWLPTGPWAVMPTISTRWQTSGRGHSATFRSRATTIPMAHPSSIPRGRRLRLGGCACLRGRQRRPARTTDGDPGDTRGRYRTRWASGRGGRLDIRRQRLPRPVVGWVDARLDELAEARPSPIAIYGSRSCRL